MDRIIFHIDVNNAFLSWEATYRKDSGQKGVDLREIPSVIGGDELSRKGIVLAKSEPAKKLGIKTGETLFSARKKAGDLVVAPSNFSIYKYYSNKLYSLLYDYCDCIEKYSIDEYFLDYTSSKNLFGDHEKIAYEIKERVKSELGFSVNIGIGENKLLAKMAGELKKPDAVNTLYLRELGEKMEVLPVSELFMVGRKTTGKLNSLNIFTIGQLKSKSLSFLQSHFKTALGKTLYEYSRGIDDSIVDSSVKLPKSIGNSTTLKEDTNDYEVIKNIFMVLSESVAIRLRQKNLRGNSVGIVLKDYAFSSYSHQKTLDFHTSSTHTILKTVMELFEDCYKGEKLRLLGVKVGGLSNCVFEQTTFLSTNEDDKKQKEIESVIDDIRKEFGISSIKKGAHTLKNLDKIEDREDIF